MISQLKEKNVNVGAKIQHARLQKGLSIEAISRRTFIKSHLLEALESNQYTTLPAPIYIVGYLKQVAHQLGLNDSELIEEYRAQTTQSGPALSGLGEQFTPVCSSRKGLIKISEIKSPQHTQKGSIPMENPSPPQVTSGSAPIVDTIEGPRKDALAMKLQAEQYADRVLGQLESDIENTLSIIQNGRQHLQERIKSYKL